MGDKNRELLSEVIKDRLETVLDSEVGSDEARTAYKEAMEAIDRQTKLAELDASREERRKNEEFRAKEAKRERIFKWVELGAIAVAVPVAKELVKLGFAKLVMRFETTDSFTSTPGKSTSSFFRF